MFGIGNKSKDDYVPISDKAINDTLKWWIFEGRIQALRIREAERKNVNATSIYKGYYPSA